MDRSHLVTTLTACLAAVLTTAVITHAGPLDPPSGTIKPTYRTLSEVEPRTPINDDTTPGDADSIYRITKPGSYFLTEAVLGTTGKMGIEIAADHVTIDLRGFRMQGTASSLAGINTATTCDDITVMNGTVTGWGGDGIRLYGSDATGYKVLNVTTSSNGNTGIRVGGGAIITGCTSSNNTESGFIGLGNAVIENCTANDNGADGFVLYYGSTIRSSSARDNGLDGIKVNESCVVDACSAYANGSDGINSNFACTITNSSSAMNLENGITCGLGSTITNCTAKENAASGIDVSSASIVKDNNCADNGSAGIRVFGGDSRIEGNNVRTNVRGIDVDSVGNIVVRNTASGNTTANYSIVSGNVCYVVSAITSGVINGSSGGTAPGSTDPSANFAY
jgi:hypothetical protein